jgi:peptide/nickel transport system ATP-binding protein
MNYPLLRIEDLRIEFRGDHETIPAVDHISFSVNRGELVAIVGESGSGKSVTALSLLQLLQSPPAKYGSGEIFFSEQGGAPLNLLELGPSGIRTLRGNKISMIFQEPMTSLNPVLSCGAQVKEAILAHQSITGKAAKQKAIELFHKVGLPEPSQVYNRYPHQLSGGQRQRVMIAMAMSCEPVLLIADEPTTALDVTVQKTILHLIRDLQRENNMAVIFITHDLGLVGEIADRVLVMYRGKIVEQSGTAEIFTQPRHPYTRALLACRPVLYGKDKRLPVVGDFIPEELSETDRNARPTGKKTGARDLPAMVETFAGGDHQTAPEIRGTQMLEVRNLKVWFPAKKNILGRVLNYVKAVDDLSFDVYSGETLGLVGESGCGKTTLGRTLLRLLTPTAGSILFEGRDLISIPDTEMRKLRKEMQIIFQDPYSSLNTEKHSKEKVIELLEKVNLESGHYNRYPHEFSGGQRQRICIARALALNPSFIVCDESVSALDVSVQAQVLNLLNDLKKEFGFTTVFISHDLAVVHYISDRIMVMNKGKIEEIGPAGEVYHHPVREYTQKLIDSMPKGFTGN